MFASQKGNKETVKSLIDKGADVNAKTNNDDTAMCIASRMGHKEIVELLSNAKLMQLMGSNNILGLQKITTVM